MSEHVEHESPRYRGCFYCIEDRPKEFLDRAYYRATFTTAEGVPYEVTVSEPWRTKYGHDQPLVTLVRMSVSESFWKMGLTWTIGCSLKIELKMTPTYWATVYRLTYNTEEEYEHE